MRSTDFEVSSVLETIREDKNNTHVETESRRKRAPNSTVGNTDIKAIGDVGKAEETEKFPLELGKEFCPPR